MRGGLILIPVTALVLAACSSTEPLLAPRSAVVPAGLDLSGRWELREEFAGTTQEIKRAEQQALGSEGSLLWRRNRSDNDTGKRGKGSLLHVFLESGSLLKITQTEHALFVSFDRAVVEEYSFGAHGMVNMGEIAAERSAGWEDSSFVVETADDKGGRLHERYALNAAGTELKRSIRLTRKKLPPLEVTQIFDRTD